MLFALSFATFPLLSMTNQLSLRQYNFFFEPQHHPPLPPTNTHARTHTHTHKHCHNHTHIPLNIQHTASPTSQDKTKIFPAREEGSYSRITCVALTDDFLYYGTEAGTVEVFFLGEYVLLAGIVRYSE